MREHCASSVTVRYYNPTDNKIIVNECHPITTPPVSVGQDLLHWCQTHGPQPKRTEEIRWQPREQDLVCKVETAHCLWVQLPATQKNRREGAIWKGCLCEKVGAGRRGVQKDPVGQTVDCVTWPLQRVQSKTHREDTRTRTQDIKREDKTVDTQTRSYLKESETERNSQGQHGADSKLSRASRHHKRARSPEYCQVKECKEQTDGDSSDQWRPKKTVSQ